MNNSIFDELMKLIIWTKKTVGHSSHKKRRHTHVTSLSSKWAVLDSNQ